MKPFRIKQPNIIKIFSWVWKNRLEEHSYYCNCDDYEKCKNRKSRKVISVIGWRTAVLDSFWSGRSVCTFLFNYKIFKWKGYW